MNTSLPTSTHYLLYWAIETPGGVSGCQISAARAGACGSWKQATKEGGQQDETTMERKRGDPPKKSRPVRRGTSAGRLWGGGGRWLTSPHGPWCCTPRHHVAPESLWGVPQGCFGVARTERGASLQEGKQTEKQQQSDRGGGGFTLLPPVAGIFRAEKTTLIAPNISGRE